MLTGQNLQGMQGSLDSLSLSQPPGDFGYQFQSMTRQSEDHDYRAAFTSRFLDKKQTQLPSIPQVKDNCGIEIGY